MSKFWKWVKNKTPTDENQASESGRTLFLNGVIDDEKFWGDEVTPREFRDELFSDSGDVTVWINSPGGSVFAADQIYNMLRDYHGKVTVKIDAIAASAASVIAMAGDDVQISPVATMMIHNPSTIALGTADDLAKAIQMLQSIKESILNAYMLKTGMSHKKLSDMMDAETFLDAKQCLSMGFADSIISRGEEKAQEEGREVEEKKTAQNEDASKMPMLFETIPFTAARAEKIIACCTNADAKERRQETEERDSAFSVTDAQKRLELLKQAF